MRFVLVLLIALLTVGLVAAGWVQSGGMKLRAERTASTPEEAVRALLADIQAHNWDQAYARLQMLKFVRERYKPGQHLAVMTLTARSVDYDRRTHDAVATGAPMLETRDADDRIATVSELLTGLGIGAETGDDRLVVRGGRLQPGTVDSHGDHRIAMAGAVAGLAADGTTRIEGWDAVATSYPGFEEDLRQCVS